MALMIQSLIRNKDCFLLFVLSVETFEFPYGLRPFYCICQFVEELHKMHPSFGVMHDKLKQSIFPTVPNQW